MTEDLRARAWAAAATVCDPELPALTIEDLGVLRAIHITGGDVEVEITPTYSGCPAMAMIKLDIETALHQAGITARVTTTLSPPWTTDWLTPAAHEKLRRDGIAPPPPASSRRALFGSPTIGCPRCASTDTEELAAFGSTACKALWRCRACREPFDLFKCH